MKNFFSKLFSALISPAALGIVITLVFTFFSWHYYLALSQPPEDAGLIESLLVTAHQKSIDMRLKQRGERAGSPEVGLLTVDEKAVASVGRWPWPREVTAKAVANAVKYGAKVISFDMVFSEPSHQPAAEIYENIKKEIPLSAELDQKFRDEIASKDSDRKMGQIFAQVAPNLVMGSFSSDLESVSSNSGKFDACLDLIFSTTREHKLWVERESIGLVVTDPYLPIIPGQIQELYKQILKDREEEIRASFPPPKSAIERQSLVATILDDQTKYCRETWLDPVKDDRFQVISENWQALAQTESEEFAAKYPTFDSWLTDFQKRSLPNSIQVTSGWTMNIDEVMPGDGNYNNGYFNANLDADGTIRRSNLIYRTGNTYMPSIALKAFLLAKNYNAQIKIGYDARTQKKGVQTFEVTDNETGDKVFTVPVDFQGRLAINYAGRRSMFPYISMADLLDESDTLTYEQRTYDAQKKTWSTSAIKAKKEQFLKDKVFILGATAIGIFDLRVTPFDENFPGAETHVNVADNLLRRDFLVTNANEELYMLGGLLTLGVALSLFLTYLGAVPGLTLVTSLLGGLFLIDKFLLFGKGTVIAIVLPILLILILFIFLISYKYLTEERGKRELRQTFQKYVSPAIVEEILSDPSNIELGGRKARVTIFFSDVRGFTTISEKLDPRALSDLLNSYLTPMTDLVFKNRGTLDKYMGDAIMAFFGAPLAYEDHAKHACHCALQNIEKLYELQRQFAAKGLPMIDVGIGLNTGEVSVGNMGSETVRSYTVMGDAVNLASRLEGINKQYGTRIIISEFTHADVHKDFVTREVDWVRVKGKVLPVKIFELISENRAPEKVAEVVKWFQEGYNLYHEQKWQTAMQRFNTALNINPEDPVSKLYVERCQEFIAEPPPSDWDGVFIMKTK